MNVKIGTEVSLQFLFLGIFASNFRYGVFPVLNIILIVLTNTLVYERYDAWFSQYCICGYVLELKIWFLLAYWKLLTNSENSSTVVTLYRKLVQAFR
jgi:hypothetical protein